MAAQDMSIGYVWFSFKGRINRAAFWLKYFVPVLVICIVGSVLDYVLGTFYVTETGVPIGIIGNLVGLLMLWPMLAAGAKRCHDRDRTGWFQLIYLIPLFGALWMFIYLGFLVGTDGPNRFGPDRLGGQGAMAPDGLAQSEA